MPGVGSPPTQKNPSMSPCCSAAIESSRPSCGLRIDAASTPAPLRIRCETTSTPDPRAPSETARPARSWTLCTSDSARTTMCTYSSYSRATATIGIARSKAPVPATASATASPCAKPSTAWPDPTCSRLSTDPFVDCAENRAAELLRERGRPDACRTRSRPRSSRRRRSSADGPPSRGPPVRRRRARPRTAGPAEPTRSGAGARSSRLRRRQLQEHAQPPAVRRLDPGAVRRRWRAGRSRSPAPDRIRASHASGRCARTGRSRAPAPRRGSRVRGPARRARSRPRLASADTSIALPAGENFTALSITASRALSAIVSSAAASTGPSSVQPERRRPWRPPRPARPPPGARRAPRDRSDRAAAHGPVPRANPSSVSRIRVIRRPSSRVASTSPSQLRSSPVASDSRRSSRALSGLRSSCEAFSANSCCRDTTRSISPAMRLNSRIIRRSSGGPGVVGDPGVHVAALDRLHREIHAVHRFQHPRRQPQHHQQADRDREHAHDREHGPLPHDLGARCVHARRHHDRADHVAVVDDRLDERLLGELPRQQRPARAGRRGDRTAPAAPSPRWARRAPARRPRAEPTGGPNGPRRPRGCRTARGSAAARRPARRRSTECSACRALVTNVPRSPTCCV